MIETHLGDITQAEADAIVNAANETLLGGGGVDAAIHRAAGPELLAACRSLPETAPGVRCPTGEARLTPAFGLSARFVVHAVGPIYGSDPNPAVALRSAYENSLRLAVEHGCLSVAFPAISCGVYAYPLDAAAEIAVAACRPFSSRLALSFWLFGEATERAWCRALRG